MRRFIHTHALLWWLTDDAALSRAAHQRAIDHILSCPPGAASPPAAPKTIRRRRIKETMDLKYLPREEIDRLAGVLLQNLRQQAPELRRVLEEVNGEWCYEDGIYRYYHQSFEAFALQDATRQMADALATLAPEGRPLDNPLFNDILRQGTGRVFSLEDNKRWQERVGPILNAFFHARYFLEMAVKYSEMPELPALLPSGWAALLCLYGLY
jgi:hypothetical protein